MFRVKTGLDNDGRMKEETEMPGELNIQSNMQDNAIWAP